MPVNVPAEPSRKDAAPVQDDGIKPYTIIIPAGHDMSDQTLYAYLCADVAQRNRVPISQDRFDGLVGAMAYDLQDKGKALIVPEIPAGQLRARGEFDVDGKRVIGYEMTITPELQRDFLARAQEELKRPPPAPELSEAFKEKLGKLDTEAADLQKKFEALDAWYKSKNTRHGLDGYTDFYLERAEGDALALQNARNEAKNPNLLNSETRLQSGLAQATQRMDELFKDHRNMTPEEMVKRLNDRYEAGFAQAKQVSELVGKIPGPVGSVGEFSINQLCNGLRLASGDITPGQALAEFGKDGSKMVVSLAVKSEKADKFIDKAADYIGDLAVNVSKRVAEAEKSLKDNPKLDRQETMRSAILQGAGDATLNLVGKTVKFDKYGLGGSGADTVKDFGVTLGKNLIEEYQNTTKKLAKEDRLDKGQLYREGAARALINAAADTFGKSAKGFGQGKGEREFLIEVATKLGVQDPIKQYLDNQKSLAEPKPAADGKTQPLAPATQAAPNAPTTPATPAAPTTPSPVPRSATTPDAADGRTASREAPADGASNPMLAKIQEKLAADPALKPLVAGDGGGNLAAALAASAARSGMNEVGNVVLSKDGTRLIAVQGDERGDAYRTASVAVQDGLKQPAGDSLRQLAETQAANQAVAPQQDPARTAPKVA